MRCTTTRETGVSKVDGRAENGEEKIVFRPSSSFSAQLCLLLTLNYCGRENKGTTCCLWFTVCDQLQRELLGWLCRHVLKQWGFQLKVDQDNGTLPYKEKQQLMFRALDLRQGKRCVQDNKIMSSRTYQTLCKDHDSIQQPGRGMHLVCSSLPSNSKGVALEQSLNQGAEWKPGAWVGEGWQQETCDLIGHLLAQQFGRQSCQSLVPLWDIRDTLTLTYTRLC